jgi:hypothetical protein
MVKWKPRWAAAALAMAMTAAAGHAPAPRTTSSWRIVKTFTGSSLLEFNPIATSGATNAWLLGALADPKLTFVTQRWNGSSWVPVAPPAQLRHATGIWELFSGIYTTSPSNTWFFPVLTKRGALVQYAMRWDGSAWRTYDLSTSPDTVLGAAAFSSSNVWAFGETDAPFPDYAPAVVRHWNGTAWQTVSVPVGTPAIIDGVSPNDIWALGASEATIHAVHQTIVAMHWNGTAWSALRLPKFPPVQPGHPWVPNAIWAPGPGEAWVTEAPAPNQRGFQPPGLIMLQWNGSTWRTVAKNLKLQDVTGLTPDGHGGFWLSAVNGANGSIIDYRNGTFSSQPAPGLPGYAGYAFGIVAVPGTGSYWAMDGLTPLKTGLVKAGILRYTP